MEIIKNSYWIGTTPQTTYEQLTKEIKTDVAIIGGGISGITTAYLLKNLGVKTVLIEANKIGGGTTGHTTAKITIQHDLIYHRLIKEFGFEKARIYADANKKAIEKIDQIVKDNNIDCSLERKDAYIFTTTSEYIEDIENETAAAQRLLIDAHCTTNTELPYPVLSSVCFKNQAQFHPLKYLKRLAELSLGENNLIFENSRAIEIENNEVRTKEGKIIADKIVIATHYPIINSHGYYFLKIYQDRSYVSALKNAQNFNAMYLDAKKEGDSFRSCEGYTIYSVESHRTGQMDKNISYYEKMKDRAKKLYNDCEISYMWSAQDCFTLDRVPYIGKYCSSVENLYVATGFAKWGMTNGTVAGMLLSDLIVENKNDWSEMFSPLRMEMASSSAKEFFTIAGTVAKNFAVDSLTKGENPRCSHMGCKLEKNNDENSFDCPCHGSRFNEKGEILDSPAIKGLEGIVQ